MLIVKFAIRETKIIWWINDNYIMLLVFLVTMISGVFYRRRKNANKLRKMPNITGGNIDKCIDPNAAYELLDRPTEIVLKQMLIILPEAGPIIISVPLLIVAYVVSRQPLKQLTILGVDLVVDKFITLAFKIGLALGSGSIFFLIPIGVVSLTTTLLAGAILFNVVEGLNSFECDDFVSKISMEKVSDDKYIGYLEKLPQKTPKVFIQGSEKTEFFIPKKQDVCSSEYKQVTVKKSNIKTEPQTEIERKCVAEYIPLKQRTKTLSDLKKEDSTAVREEAAPYIKRYEEKRKRINDNKVK
jgi:hypothetical protein